MMMAIGLAIAGTGCLTDEELDEGAELGETAQALSNISYHHLTNDEYDTEGLGAAPPRQAKAAGLAGHHAEQAGAAMVRCPCPSASRGSRPPA